MRGKLLFLGGLAAGFVLGARAGREKYEELRTTALKIKENPTVQEAVGVVQEQATKLYSESKTKATDKLANSRFADTEVGQRLLSSTDTTTGAHAIEHDTLTGTGSSTKPSTGSSTKPSTGSSAKPSTLAGTGSSTKPSPGTSY